MCLRLGFADLVVFSAVDLLIQPEEAGVILKFLEGLQRNLIVFIP